MFIVLFHIPYAPRNRIAVCPAKQQYVAGHES